jgi:hypothetical protein
MPFHRALNPVPLGDEEIGQTHVREAMANEMSGQTQQNFPDLFAAHPSVPGEAEEEAFAIEFDTQLSVARAQVPSYFKWWLARPHCERAHLYDYLRLILQCVQWQDGGRKDRPFVLKSPMHLGEMPSLLEAFPNATVVHCHRDLNTVVASAAHRGVRRGGVEFGHGRHPPFGELLGRPATHYPDPLPFRCAGGLFTQHRQGLTQCGHAVPAQLEHIVQATANHVQVAVVEPGDQPPAQRVDHPRARAEQGGHVRLVTDRDQHPVPYRQAARGRARRITGEDLCVAHHQVRGADQARAQIRAQVRARG